jgi:hypothetical protein
MDEKIKKIIFRSIWVAIIILIIVAFYFLQKVKTPTDFSYGVSFSNWTVENYGLDWGKAYLEILDDLKVDRIRLSAYWNKIEPQMGQYNFNDLDWMVVEADKRGIKIVLAVGSRLPRWPECHYPDWTDNFTEKQVQRETLIMIRQVVDRYKKYENIYAWQVENEPFLSHFSECPEVDKDFLDQEIALVKSLDRRPVIVTDSGELSTWHSAYKRADIFGTTMYHYVYARYFKSYMVYPIPSSYFRIKINLMRLFYEDKPMFVSELEAEPWGPVSIQEMSREEQSKTMDLDKFRKILKYARNSGFDEFYLWGVEWWYWLKETQDDPSLWEEAKQLWK